MSSRPDLSILSRDGSSVPPPASAWKSRVLLPLLVLSSFAGLGAWTARDRLRPPIGVVVAPVVSRTVEVRAASVSFQAAGWVEPDPYPVQVSALADGVVREVLVLEGDRVEAGQVVVRMIDDDARLALAAAEAEVRHREEAIASARARLRAAQRRLETLVEPDRAIGEAEARLAEVDAELARLDALAGVHRAKVAELEEKRAREARVAQGGAFAELEAIRTGHQLAAEQAALAAEEGRRGVLEAQARRHRTDLAAAREARELLIEETLAVEETRAALAVAEADRDLAIVARDQAKLRLERMEIRSPIGGIVLHRMTAPGTKLMLGMDSMTSAHAIHVYDPARLQIRVDVPLADAGKVSVGQDAEIAVEVLSDRTFKGRITRVLHSADIQKNTLEVKVVVLDPDPALRPEMLARVRFLAPAGADEGPAECLFVPEAAVHKEGTGDRWVWVVDEGHRTVERRVVTAGRARLEGWLEIAEGLAPGDSVVVDAPADLEPDRRIEILGEAAHGLD